MQCSSDPVALCSGMLREVVVIGDLRRKDRGTFSLDAVLEMWDGRLSKCGGIRAHAEQLVKQKKTGLQTGIDRRIEERNTGIPLSTTVRLIPPLPDACWTELDACSRRTRDPVGGKRRLCLFGFVPNQSDARKGIFDMQEQSGRTSIF